MIELLRAVFGRSRRSTIHECRRCGTTVEAATCRCPTCGAEAIATYTF